MNAHAFTNSYSPTLLPILSTHPKQQHDTPYKQSQKTKACAIAVTRIEGVKNARDRLGFGD
jgi:hypothetical protein